MQTYLDLEDWCFAQNCLPLNRFDDSTIENLRLTVLDHLPLNMRKIDEDAIGMRSRDWTYFVSHRVYILHCSSSLPTEFRRLRFLSSAFTDRSNQHRPLWCIVSSAFPRKRVNGASPKLYELCFLQVRSAHPNAGRNTSSSIPSRSKTHQKWSRNSYLNLFLYILVREKRSWFTNANFSSHAFLSQSRSRKGNSGLPRILKEPKEVPWDKF